MKGFHAGHVICPLLCPWVVCDMPVMGGAGKRLQAVMGRQRLQAVRGRQRLQAVMDNQRPAPVGQAAPAGS